MGVACRVWFQPFLPLLTIENSSKFYEVWHLGLVNVFQDNTTAPCYVYVLVSFEFGNMCGSIFSNQVAFGTKGTTDATPLFSVLHKQIEQTTGA